MSRDGYGSSEDEDMSGNNGASGSGKKGKETSKEVDQRKEQNRIAQREFRQRKQQYIKGLEARVALHEASKDDQLDQMRTGIAALLDENQRLRELLASVSGFIGEGLGGVLPRLAIEHKDFEDLITRSRNTHIVRTLETFREQKEGATPSASGGPSGSKRARTDDLTSTGSPSNHLPPSSAFSFATPPDRRSDVSLNFGHPPFSAPLPSQSAPIPSSFQPPSFPTPPNLPTANSGSNPGLEPQQTSAMAQAAGGGPAPTFDGDDLKVQETMTNFQKMHKEDAGKKEFDDHDDIIQELFSMPTDNPMLQAIQLISYHMRNKREQPGYHLPPSLQATVTQQTVPHSPFFDGIIFASLRDRLILLKDQYDQSALLSDLIEAFQIHEDDILLPANWELSESFIRKYWYVIDREVLSITNRWRKERGEVELSLRDIVPDGQDIAAEGALGKKTRS